MKKRLSLVLACLMLLALVLPLSTLAADEHTPVPSHKGGTYYETFDLALTTSLNFGVIYYTMDGKDPDPINGVGTQYEKPIPMGGFTETRTIKAATYYMGSQMGNVMTESYTLDGRPFFSTKGGTYDSLVTLELSSKLGEASLIRYTLDGTNPTSTSTKYEGPIHLNKDTTVKAGFFFLGKLVGSYSEEIYHFKAKTPAASVKGGAYQTAQTVTLSTATTDAKIYYSTDGTEPVISLSTLYKEPIKVTENMTIKAIAVKLLGATSSCRSDTMTEAYVIGATAATPTASPAAGGYNGPQDITLTCATEGATIWYRTDGKAPTGTADELYTKPFRITKDTTVKAVAGKEGLQKSPVMTVSYQIQQDPGSMENFLPKNTYTKGMFTDVNEGAWYGLEQQKVVARAYEYGLMKGDSATTFNPGGNVTLAEAITMAARVHSIYMTGTESFTQGSPWYQVYVDYAVANGIISSKDFSSLTRAATRSEMAYIFYHALPAVCYPNKLLTVEPPDVSSSTPYYAEIYNLYGAGVLGGSDALGTFYPGNNITRAEVSAIIARVILPETRLGHNMSS